MAHELYLCSIEVQFNSISNTQRFFSLILIIFPSFSSSSSMETERNGKKAFYEWKIERAGETMMFKRNANVENFVCLTQSYIYFSDVILLV